MQAAANPAVPREPGPAARPLLERARRYLSGHDVFISYARRDAVEYAIALADALRKRGLDAYVDQLGTPPGPKMPPQLLLRLRLSSMMVLIASPAAASSQAVRQEVETFVQKNRKLFVVDVAGGLDGQEWYSSQLKGGPTRVITGAELAAGAPSPAVVDQIEKSVDFARREDRMRKFLRRAGIGVATLVLVGVAGSLFATARLASLGREMNLQTALAGQAEERARDAGIRERAAGDRERAAKGRERTATEKARLADQLAIRAQADAVRAAELRDRAQGEAARAAAAARTAMDTVEARRRVGRALEMANRASATMDGTGDGLARGALLTLESLEVAWTVEGLTAWMRFMNLIPPRLHLHQAHAGRVAALAASPDGRRLASSGPGGEVQLWDVRGAPDGLRRTRISAVPVGGALRHGGTVMDLAFSHDGRWLAAAGAGGRAWIWDLETRQARDLPLGSGGQTQVRALTFSPDGRWLALACGRAGTWLFDARTGNGRKLSQGSDSASAVAFSGDSRWLVSGRRTLDVWNVKGGGHVSHEELPRAATALAFSHDGRMLAIATGSGVQLREASAGAGDTLRLSPLRAMDMSSGRSATASLSFSRDGRYVAHARATGATTHVWEVKTGREVTRVPEVSGGLAFGAGWMATGHDDGSVGFWPADDAKEMMRITHPDDVLAAAFSDGGRWLATASGDAVRVFDGRTFSSAHTIPRAEGVSLLGFSPGGEWLVSGRDSVIEVTRGGEWGRGYRRRLRGVPMALAFSPDGRRLATWYGRRCVRNRPELRVWDLATGAELARDWRACELGWDEDASPGDRFGPAALLAAADGWPRVTRDGYWTSLDGAWKAATPDSVAVLTEASTGREVARLGHADVVNSLALSPGGRWLATASRDNTLRLWAFGAPDVMIAEACARLPHHFRERSPIRNRDGTTTIPVPPRNLCAERAAAGGAPKR